MLHPRSRRQGGLFFARYPTQATRYQTMQTAIIRPKQTAAMFGVSLSTVWNWNNPKHKQFRPDFPKPIKVSANATGWLQSELEDYLQKLAESR
jgi:conserved domain protein